MGKNKETTKCVSSSIVGSAIGSVATGLGITSLIFGKFPIIKGPLLSEIAKQFGNNAIGKTVSKVLGTVTATVAGAPGILPIATGLLAAGAGALIGKKVSKSKLKHQSLKVGNLAKAM